MHQAIQIDHQAILQEVVHILEEMTSDWDTGFSGGIGAETCLVADLGCESIDVVQFVVAIEERFQRRDFPIETLLMVEDRYVDDLRVSDVVAFLDKHLKAGGRHDGYAADRP
jgi:acyl carrier protein